MHFASPKADASWSEKVFKLCKKNKQRIKTERRTNSMAKMTKQRAKEFYATMYKNS